MLRESDGVLIGVLTPGIGLCGNPDFFSIYTRIAEVREWITRKSGV